MKVLNTLSKQERRKRSLTTAVSNPLKPLNNYYKDKLEGSLLDRLLKLKRDASRQTDVYRSIFLRSLLRRNLF